MVKYFGTDGVRGVANKELSPELAFKLGRFGGDVLAKEYEGSGTPQILVARDTRISGQMLEYALISGILSVGVNVMRVGVLTTPGLAYLTRVQGAVAGVMISASHNPAPDNGIKFIGSDGYKLSDEQEDEIEALLHEEDTLDRPSTEGLGIVEDYKEGVWKYTQFLTQTIDSSLSDISVVLDGANGAASPLLNRLFADLETDFEVINAEPNGLNINENAGSTNPGGMGEVVVESGADVGLAFDGDGDRVIAVDENGDVVDGDKIMYICGKSLHGKERLKQDTVVTTVMSNIGLYKAFEEIGIQTVKTKVGDRYVVEEMRENGYNFGGEQSGHIVFNEYHTTGDGLLTGIQLLEVMQETGKPLSELASEITLYPQELINVKVEGKHKYDALENEAIKAVIDEVEEELGSEGRVLVRPSGTEDLLRVMVEGPTEETALEYAERIAVRIEEEIGKV